MENASGTETRRSRRLTRVLIAAGCAFLGAGLILGVADKPPGLVLVYAAVSAWILAGVHRWRRPKPFLILLAASLAGFFVAVILHNLLYALALMTAEMAILPEVLGFLEVLFFLVGVLVCPPGVLIGALGSLVVALVRWRRGKDAGAEP